MQELKGLTIIDHIPCLIKKKIIVQNVIDLTYMVAVD